MNQDTERLSYNGKKIILEGLMQEFERVTPKELASPFYKEDIQECTELMSYLREHKQLSQQFEERYQRLFQTTAKQ